MVSKLQMKSSTAPLDSKAADAATAKVVDQKAKGFSFKVPDLSEENMPKGYKFGDVVSSAHPKQLFEFLESFIQDEAAATRIGGTKQAQKLIVVRKAYEALEDTKDDMAVVTALVDALQQAPFALRGADSVPTQDALKGDEVETLQAAKYGAMVDQATADHATKGIDGLRDSQATSLWLKADLVRQFGNMKDANGAPVMNSWPTIGTRNVGGHKRDGTSTDRAPHGYRLSSETFAPNDPRSKLPIYNGTFEYYKDAAGKRQRWTSVFVARGIGKQWQRNVDILRSLKTRVVPDDCPEDWKQHVGTTALDGLISDQSLEFNRRVLAMAEAIALWQVEQELSRFDRDDYKITLGLYGETLGDTAEKAARRQKPFVLYAEAKATDSDRWIATPSVALTRSVIKNLNPRQFPVTAKVADLLAKKKRGTDKTDGNKAGTTPAGALVAEIATTDRFEEYLSAVANYIDNADRHARILSVARDPKDGGQLASAIVTAKMVLTDLASSEGIVALAQAYAAREDKQIAAAEGSKNK